MRGMPTRVNVAFMTNSILRLYLIQIWESDLIVRRSFVLVERSLSTTLLDQIGLMKRLGEWGRDAI